MKHHLAFVEAPEEHLAEDQVDGLGTQQPARPIECEKLGALDVELEDVDLFDAELV